METFFILIGNYRLSGKTRFGKYCFGKTVIRPQSYAVLFTYFGIFFFFFCVSFRRITCFNTTDRKSAPWTRTCLPWPRLPTTVCRRATSISLAWFRARAVPGKRRLPNSFCNTCALWPVTWARGWNSRYLRPTLSWSLSVREIFFDSIARAPFVGSVCFCALDFFFFSVYVRLVRAPLTRVTCYDWADNFGFSMRTVFPRAFFYANFADYVFTRPRVSVRANKVRGGFRLKTVIPPLFKILKFSTNKNTWTNAYNGILT